MPAPSWQEITWDGALERQPRAELGFATGVHGHGDGSKLRLVHKAVGGSIIGVVQGVEQFPANLHVQRFQQAKLAGQGNIRNLHSRTFHGITSGIAEGVGGRSDEGGGIEPLHGIMGAGAEHGLPRVIGADGIFTQRGAGVCRVAKHRDREGHSRLRLVNRGQFPMVREAVHPPLLLYPGQVVNERADVA